MLGSHGSTMRFDEEIYGLLWNKHSKIWYPASGWKIWQYQGRYSILKSRSLRIYQRSKTVREHDSEHVEKVNKNWNRVGINCVAPYIENEFFSSSTTKYLK